MDFLSCKYTLPSHTCLASNPPKACPPSIYPCSLYWYWGLPQLRCKTLHLILLNYMSFPWAPTSTLSGSKLHLAVSLLISVLTEPLSLVLSTNFLGVHSIPQYVSLIKILNTSGPYMYPSGALLVTGLHMDTEPLAICWMQPFGQCLIHQIVHSSISSQFSDKDVVLDHVNYLKQD